MPTISKPKAPLSLLPLSNLVRAYAITALSSYPLLMAPSLRLLSFVAHSPSVFLNPDRNPLLHWILKKTFYAQFCAGETKQEVQSTIKGLKEMGYKGVILAYGKEIVLARGEKISKSSRSSEHTIQKDVQEWKEGTLKTVQMAHEGDFIGLKFSGAGRDAMRQLAAGEPPTRDIAEATTDICELAKARGVRLLFDAEQDAVQHGIDAWTLQFQHRYNNAALDQAIVYGTYQSYLRSTPETLMKHLATAQRKGFTLGVKLVRGAYMASDPRALFWSTKDETDKVYDGIAEALIRRTWNDVLKPAEAQTQREFPNAALVLASHNHATVRKAINIRKEQRERGQPRIEMAYGQLLGMADEVSCELVMAAKAAGISPFEKRDCSGPKAYKYLVWGSVGECLKYLVRRAEENRDAVIRAKGTRMALRSELGRRIWG
ncbi:proline dehydrogenase, partial [Lecanoromycetidae sp. Uapishka_2]